MIVMLMPGVTRIYSVGVITTAVSKARIATRIISVFTIVSLIAVSSIL